uniref:Uncharacterized protein n=2 Tax=Cercopithecinae TaxID=9528 RepID=A0A2K5XX57_MANLE|nr:unnamed protein product [Macaca fascicularis]
MLSDNLICSPYNKCCVFPRSYYICEQVTHKKIRENTSNLVYAGRGSNYYPQANLTLSLGKTELFITFYYCPFT